jgi:hypothetical protein
MKHRAPPPDSTTEAPEHVKRALLESLDPGLANQRPAPVAPPAPAAPAAPPAPVLTFETWARLSTRFRDAPKAELQRALAEHGLTWEQWSTLGHRHLLALMADVRARRTERKALYDALDEAEQARRAGVPAPPRPWAELVAAAERAPVLPAGVPPPPDELRSTNDVPDLRPALAKLLGEMPFPGRAPEPPGTQPAKQTQRSQVVRGRAGSTLAPDDGAMQRPTPVTPFAGGAGGLAVVEVPRLTAEEYVTLRAELRVRPDLRAEIMGRYRVLNEAGCRALWEYWNAPQRRAEYDEAAATYVRGFSAALLR